MVLPVLRACFADPGTLEATGCQDTRHLEHVSYAYTCIYICMYVSTCICTYKDIGFIYLYKLYMRMFMHIQLLIRCMHIHACVQTWALHPNTNTLRLEALAFQLLSGFRLVLCGLLAYM